MTTKTTRKTGYSSADNLKEVVVTFNQDIDAANAGTYTFAAGSGLTATVAKVDGKKVTLTVAGATSQQLSVDLTVDAVKTLAGKSVEKSTKAVKFADITAPTVAGVSVKSPGVITVSFSEPLDVIPTFKVDNGLVAITNTPALSADKKSVDLNLGVATEGSHTVTVSGGKDFAGFIVEKVDQAFTYAKDVTAPTFTVKSASETKLVLEFNEAISNVADANVVFSHSYKGTYTDTLASRNLSADGKTLTLTFANPIPNGAVNFFLGYASDAGNKLQDSWGNKVAEATFTATVASDVTAPVVTKVEAKTNTSIEVTYSEAVTGANLAANYTLKTADGTAVPFTVAAGVGNTYVVTPGAPLNGGVYTLTVKNVTDSSYKLNKIADFTTNFSVVDKVAPQLVDVDAVTLGTQVQLLSAKKVKIKFDEAMDVVSLLNKNNYTYNGAALDANVLLSVADANKSVVLDFTNVTAANPAGANIVVGRVADAAGNLITAFANPVVVQATPAAPAFTKAEVTGANSVKFYFDEVITALQAADFEIKLGAGLYVPAQAISVSVVDGKTVVTATTQQTLPTTGAGVVVQTAAAPTGKNLNDVAIAIAADTATSDKYAPVLLSSQAVDTDNDTFVNQFVLTFSENLYVASVQEADFAIEGYVVTGVTVAGATATVTVTEKTVDDLAATPKVTLVGAVEDTARNIRNTQDYVVAVSAGIFASKAALNTSITAAQAAHDAATEGVASGEYPAGSKATLSAAITAATNVYNNASATKAQLDTAKATLDTAVTAFVPNP
jgi:hypothetical protein